MELRIGPPVNGKNFYKRPVLIHKLLRVLEGNNVAFLGPRRTGKTSCLEEIKAQSGQFLPILLNLEKHDTVEARLSEMLAELREALAEPKRQLAWLADKTGALLAGIQKIDVPGIGSVELAKSQVKAPWRKSADESLNLVPWCLGERKSGCGDRSPSPRSPSVIRGLVNPIQVDEEILNIPPPSFVVNHPISLSNS